MAKKIDLLKADFCPQGAGRKASSTEEAFRARQSYPVEGLSGGARVPPLAVLRGVCRERVSFRKEEQVFTWLGEAWLKFKFSYFTTPWGKDMLFAPGLLP